MIFHIYKILRALITRKIKFEIDLVPLEFEGLPLKKIINWILTDGQKYIEESGYILLPSEEITAQKQKLSQ